MQEAIERLRADGLARIEQAAGSDQLEAVRVGLLGRKGEVTTLLRGLRDVDAAARPALGAALNRLKDELTAALARRDAALGGPQAASTAIDLTLPGRLPVSLGTTHPLLTVLEEIGDIFFGMGYDVSEGPEVELDYYNFTALNFPDDHPARDIQDTFFLGKDLLLRTQTSPVQVRTMERVQPPLAYVFPGRVYRNENADASHSSEFYQIEGLRVDRDISLVDLRRTVETFVASFFGEPRPTRFRPHFFPFTEPSVEVDMQCMNCGGSGCGVCGQTGWLEIMGAGMVHPNVFQAVGYPPDAYTGFAFGMGIDRIAMLRYGIRDIRLLYENDLRFLDQFRGVL
ncbi:MAG TPA: phenylalanine--tRNA ligase subunit alpha [Candidatus Krumholzibacteria bacterium]|nr:phenylalanine--tRNA ligase subunit alpha [Candidatus Krumholzibacteria bacterium]HPD71514.1 phenylalanine--tRNA ligase subunit alpha [Candidatus Krumholzibacteria bacterium]HRY41553.1 phenylalanine--tRNA ligase subunit alpha [Candidatus Krumholzibacteria bacterium]